MRPRHAGPLPPQSELEATLALRTLEAEVRAAKAAVLELAALPAVKAALARPGVLARVKVRAT